MSTLAGVLALLAIAAAHEVAIGYNAMTTDIQEKTIQEKNDQKFYDQIEASLESIAKQLNQLYANKVTAMKKISRLEANLAYAAHADHVVQSRGDCKVSEQEPIELSMCWNCDCKCGTTAKCAEGKYCYGGACHDKPRKCFRIDNKICPLGLKTKYQKNNIQNPQDDEDLQAAVDKLKATANKKADPTVGYFIHEDLVGWTMMAYHGSLKSFNKHNEDTWAPFRDNFRNEYCEPVNAGATMRKNGANQSFSDSDWKKEGNMVGCP